MRVRAMPPTRASGHFGLRPSAEGALPAALPGTSASQRQAAAFVMGRSLLVCALLAAGVSGSIIAFGGMVDGVQPAYAASSAGFDLAMPRPRIKLAPQAELSGEVPTPRDTVSMSARIDRVPLDFLFPEDLRNAEDLLAFGPMRVRRHLVETIHRAAKVVDIDPVLLMAIADKESSFLTDVRARTSSATGLFQFIDATWLRMMRDFGARHGLAKEASSINWVDDELVVAEAAEKTRILGLRRDPYLSALLAGEMLKRDRSRIARRIGRDLTHGETYLIHFLGPDDAERFLAKAVGEPGTAAARLLPKPARANRPIFYARAGRKAKSLSIAEVHAKFEKMMSLRLERYQNVDQIAGLGASGNAVLR